jgi:hypothetical protein
MFGDALRLRFDDTKLGGGEAQPLRRSFATQIIPAIMFGWLALSGKIPLTYDEAWNFSNLSSHGLAVAFSNYEYPNNHVVFTMIQSIIPSAWVQFSPLLLRVPNIIIVWCLLALLSWMLSRLGIRNSWIPAAVLLASPLFSLYLFVARGYLLGTALVMASAWLVAKKEREFFGGLLMGAAAATVPTFGYAAPGLLLSLVSPTDRRWARAARWLAGCSLVTAIVYLPKLRELSEHRHRWANQSDFFAVIVSAAGARPWISILLMVAAGSMLAALLWREGFHLSDLPLGPRFAVTLIAAASSFIGVVVALRLTGSVNSPFPRNALFIPLFSWLVVLIIGSWWGSQMARFAKTFLACGALAQSMLLLSTFVLRASSPETYPLYRELAGPPVARAFEARRLSPIRALEAEPAAVPAAGLYAATLGVPLRVVSVVPPTCAFGTYSPSFEKARARVAVVTASESAPLCY